MLHRFIHPGPFLPGAPLLLEGEEGHHAARSVRVRAGEKIELFDGRGNAAAASVAEVEKHRVRVVVDALLAGSRELPFRLVLAAAVLHPDKYELLLQKGTELGVSHFVPLLTDRIETRVERILGKRERWERIILEATKQCGRALTASLGEPIGFDKFAPEEGHVLFFDVEQAQGQVSPAAAVTLLVGPEGGWSDREVDRATRAGWTGRRLGPRRLRAETAALTAIVTTCSALGGLD